MSGGDKEQWRKIKQGKRRVILGKRHYFLGSGMASLINRHCSEGHKAKALRQRVLAEASALSGRDEGGGGAGGEGKTWEGRGLIGHSQDLALTLKEVGAMGGFEKRREVTLPRFSQIPSGSVWTTDCMGQGRSKRLAFTGSTTPRSERGFRCSGDILKKPQENLTGFGGNLSI